MRQKNEKLNSVNQKQESVGVRAANINKSGQIKSAFVVVGGSVLTALIIFALGYFYKKEQDAPQVVVAYSPTPQIISSPLSQTRISPAPSAIVLTKTPVQKNSVQNANQANVSSSQKQMLTDNRGEVLDGYIREYLDKYSSVDLSDINPCNPEEKKLKNSAEALLGRIESLGTELKRKDALDFVKERQGGSIRFHDCKSFNSQ